MPHKAKRNLPSSTPSTSTLTANNRRTAAAGHTYLALDHGLNDNHLGGAMHFLNLAGYGMTHARVEPHQIPLGPVHVGMLLCCCCVPLFTRCCRCRWGLRRLALSLHTWFRSLIRVRFPLLLAPLVSSRLVSFSHTQTLQAAGRRRGGEEGASRSFKWLQAG